MVKFVGLHLVQEQIHQAVAAARHEHRPVPVKHMLLHLNEGEGRTTLLRYMSETFTRNGVRNALDLDPFLEERVPDNFTELLQMVARVRSHAVYTNRFTGILGIDVASIEKHMNDTAFLNCFGDLICELAETALFVFFLPADSCPQDERVASLLGGWCDQFLVEVPSERYTPEALTRILLLLLERQHVRMDPNELHTHLSEIFERQHPPRTPSDVKRLVKTICYSMAYNISPIDTHLLNKGD